MYQAAIYKEGFLTSSSLLRAVKVDLETPNWCGSCRWNPRTISAYPYGVESDRHTVFEQLYDANSNDLSQFIFRITLAEFTDVIS